MLPKRGSDILHYCPFLMQIDIAHAGKSSIGSGDIVSNHNLKGVGHLISLPLQLHHDALGHSGLGKRPLVTVQGN